MALGPWRRGEGSAGIGLGRLETGSDPDYTIASPGPGTPRDRRFVQTGWNKSVTAGRGGIRARGPLLWHPDELGSEPIPHHRGAARGGRPFDFFFSRQIPGGPCAPASRAAFGLESTAAPVNERAGRAADAPDWLWLRNADLGVRSSRPTAGIGPNDPDHYPDSTPASAV